MKLIGKFKGVPFYSSSEIPEGIVWMMNENNFKINYPLRKNGRPDMRYKINQLQRIFKGGGKNEVRSKNPD